MMTGDEKKCQTLGRQSFNVGIVESRKREERSTERSEGTRRGDKPVAEECERRRKGDAEAERRRPRSL